MLDAIDILAGLHSLLPRLDEHRDCALRAGEAASKVLGNILSQIGAGTSTGGHLAGFVNTYVITRLSSAMNQLQESRDDPRVALITFNERYHVARRWILDGLRIIAPDMNGVSFLMDLLTGYGAWRELDGEYLTDVRKLLNVRYREPIKESLPADFLSLHLPPVSPLSPTEPHSQGPSRSTGDV